MFIIVGGGALDIVLCYVYSDLLIILNERIQLTTLSLTRWGYDCLSDCIIIHVNPLLTITDKVAGKKWLSLLLL